MLHIARSIPRRWPQPAAGLITGLFLASAVALAAGLALARH